MEDRIRCLDGSLTEARRPGDQELSRSLKKRFHVSRTGIRHPPGERFPGLDPMPCSMTRLLEEPEDPCQGLRMIRNPAMEVRPEEPPYLPKKAEAGKGLGPSGTEKEWEHQNGAAEP